MASPQHRIADRSDHRRPRPTMVSLRLKVLNFVHDYIGRWRISPSLGEIAAEFGVSRVQAHRAVESLSGSGLLVKRPGPRGLALPSACDEAMRLLTDMGLRARDVEQGVTNQQLLTMPPLDYVPPRTRGDRHGQQVKTGS